MDKPELTKQIVLCRKYVNQAKVLTVRKIIKNVKVLQRCKDEALKEQKNKKADRLLEELQIIKSLKEDEVTKFGLQTEHLEKIIQSTPSNVKEHVCAKLALSKKIQNEIQKIRNNFTDWKAEMVPMLTVKKKKKKKAKNSENTSEVDGEIDSNKTEMKGKCTNKVKKVIRKNASSDDDTDDKSEEDEEGSVETNDELDEESEEVEEGSVETNDELDEESEEDEEGIVETSDELDEESGDEEGSVETNDESDEESGEAEESLKTDADSEDEDEKEENINDSSNFSLKLVGKTVPKIKSVTVKKKLPQKEVKKKVTNKALPKSKEGKTKRKTKAAPAGNKTKTDNEERKLGTGPKLDEGKDSLKDTFTTLSEKDSSKQEEKVFDSFFIDKLVAVPKLIREDEDGNEDNNFLTLSRKDSYAMFTTKPFQKKRSFDSNPNRKSFDNNSSKKSFDRNPNRRYFDINPEKRNFDSDFNKRDFGHNLGKRNFDGNSSKSNRSSTEVKPMSQKKEELHPSWAAKQSMKKSILPFQGKKIKFSDD